MHTDTSRPLVAEEDEEYVATLMESFEATAIDRALYSYMGDAVMEVVTCIRNMASLHLDSFMDVYKERGLLAGTGEPTEDELIASQTRLRDSVRLVTPAMLWENPNEER